MRERQSASLPFFFFFFFFSAFFHHSFLARPSKLKSSQFFKKATEEFKIPHDIISHKKKKLKMKVETKDEANDKGPPRVKRPRHDDDDDDDSGGDEKGCE